MDMVKIKRFDICLVNLDPTIGSEIKKTRPAIIISPDSMNLSRLKTVIIAPMTSTIKDNFPTRVMALFKDKKGQVALDQLRAIDRSRILQKLGVVPQQIPAGDIYPALEKGTIDAAEFVGPYDDEKLGFERVAPYYYTPGWWETGSHLSLLIGFKQWEALPAAYKAAVTAAAYESHVWVQAQYDVRNPQALARLMKRGIKLRAFPQSVMEACLKAATETMQDEASKNPKFKKIYEHYTRFQREQNQWYSVTEQRMLNFQISAMTAGDKK